MTVTRYPPATSAPFARFKLTSSGREVRPDIEKGGRVVALTVDEELELLSGGFRSRSSLTICRSPRAPPSAQ
jgi:hypothetical protein